MDHDSLPPKLISNFEIIYSNPELVPLKNAEAILIKHHKLLINVRYMEL